MGDAPKNKIEGLELARFAFAMAVLVYHYLYRGPSTDRVDADPGPAKLIYLRFAVEAFFVISGYVIARSAQHSGALKFAISRAGRLWPALAACALISSAVMFFTNGYVVPIPTLLKSLLFVPMLMREKLGMVDSSYWSITIEMRFYLGIGLLLLAFRRLPKLDLIAGAWLAASAAAVIVPGLRDVTLSPYSAYFIFGMLLCSHDEGSDLAPWMMPLAFLLAGWQTFTDYALIDHGAYWLAGYAIAAVIFGVTFMMRRGVPGAIAPLVIRLGAMTYPLYLIHQRAGYCLINWLTPHVGHWPALAATTAAALGVAYALSTPFVDVKVRETLEALLWRAASVLPNRLQSWMAPPARVEAPPAG